MSSTGRDEHFSEENREFSCGGRRHRRRHRSHRKERVLHTRISEQLADDIRQLAEDLRVPASNLVRNVLEEVFTVVENVSGDVGDFFDDLVDEAEGVRERVRAQQREARARRGSARRRRRAETAEATDIEEEFRRDEAREAAVEGSASEAADDILGWQPMVLRRAVSCEGCASPLEAGTNAMMSIRADGRPGSVFCVPCSARD